MKVQAHLYGTLRRFSQPQTPGLWLGDVPAGATIRDLLAKIGASERELAMANVNKQVCALDAEIPEGAEIILVTNMGGG